MKSCCFGLLFLFAAFEGHAPEPTVVELKGDDGDLAELSWMTGSWAGSDTDPQFDEHWTHASGGTMLGVNRTVVQNRTVFFEYLRIEKTSAGIVYQASPKGRNPPTPFRLVQSEPRRAVFENPEHDFPQKIIYWRDNDVLHARIEGQENGKQKSSQWTWRRARIVAP
jgi:hypothetical protein